MKEIARASQRFLHRLLLLLSRAFNKNIITYHDILQFPLNRLNLRILDDQVLNVHVQISQTAFSQSAMGEQMWMFVADMEQLNKDANNSPRACFHLGINCLANVPECCFWEVIVRSSTREKHQCTVIFFGTRPEHTARESGEGVWLVVAAFAKENPNLYKINQITKDIVLTFEIISGQFLAALSLPCLSFEAPSTVTQLLNTMRLMLSHYGYLKGTLWWISIAHIMHKNT